MFSFKSDASYSYVVKRSNLEIIAKHGQTLPTIELPKDEIEKISKYKIIKANSLCYIILPLNTKILYFAYKENIEYIDTIAEIFYSLSEKINFAISVCHKNKELKYNLVKKSEKLSDVQKELELKIYEAIETTKVEDRISLEQSKLAIMGEMISMIAHQWRQPLSVVKMIIQTMELKNRLDSLSKDEITDTIKQASETIDFMSGTINDFRNFFNPNKKRELISLNHVIHGTLNFIKGSLSANSITLEESLLYAGEVEIITGEFTQVILNILNNSKDALIQNNIDDKKITIQTYDDKSNIYICIIDNGGGIDKNIIDKIFDPYFSTKSNSGTGIGLYMSKVIIESHMHGLLTATSEENETKFCIEIPKSK
jgi:signal transduction histidine kinase